MKRLKFRDNLAKLILSGEKNATWRLFDEKQLAVGDQLELVSWESGKVFATAEITQIKEKKLGEITEIDYLGHEKFADTSEMLKHYQAYYGDRVNMETMMKVVEFKLLTTPGATS